MRSATVAQADVVPGDPLALQRGLLAWHEADCRVCENPRRPCKTRDRLARAAGGR